jgi:hypothetical protein
VKVGDLGPKAAGEHLGYILGEALEEAGGAVPAVPKLLLILAELVVKVVVVLLVDGLATDCEGEPLNTAVTSLTFSVL